MVWLKLKKELRVSRLIAFISLMFACSLSLAQSYIPANAYVLRPMVVKEVDSIFPDIPNRAYVPALIEHESCISLRHKRCWSSTSRLKSPREEGAGLGMLTKAYNKDGGIRFDALTELRTRHRRYLAELTWDNVYQRPDLQIRALTLMVRDNYKTLYDVDEPIQRLAMTDASYNGGMGGLQRERRQCSLVKGCNPDFWFGNVERFCMKSKKVLYGNRSACDINRYHVSDVMTVRLPKYERLGFMDH